MRKCYSCKEIKNLKSIFIEDCDCHDDMEKILESPNHSVCKHCFFETCAIEFEGRPASECLEEPKDSADYKQAKEYEDNWNNYDYHWKLKKSITLSQEKK